MRYSEPQLQDEIFHGHGVMFGNVLQDRVQSAQSKRVVAWNGHVVFATKACGHTDVGASLAG
jgi:hypothetical protein